MTIPKTDEVLIEDLRRDAAIWFKDASLNDLNELIDRYLRSRKRLSKKTIDLLKEESEVERAIGSDDIATALELVIEWNND